MKNKVVLVGCGYWGKNWYNTLKSIENVQIIAVIDPNPIIKVDNQINDISEFDSSKFDFDYVIIATQAEHHRLYLEYFNSKISSDRIFIEKPCGILSEDRSIYYESYPGFLFLSSFQFKKIKELIDANTIGEILYSKFTRASMGPRIRTDVSIIEDYMIHDLYIYIALFNYEIDDLKIDKFLSSYLGDKIKSDTCTLQILNKNNNHQSTFFSSWIYPKKERSALIVGSKGSILWENDSVYYSSANYKKIQGVDDYGNIGWSLNESNFIDITPELKKSNLELEYIDFIENKKNTFVHKNLDHLLKKLIS
jgi:predicted dehydrogenase